MVNSVVATDIVANNKTSDVLKQCEAQIQQYAATATSSLASVATKWMTVGGLAGTAMGYVTGSMAQNIVELDRNAKALGVNVQAYQVFQTSARKAGVEGEQFRAVMGRFEYVLGMAKSGVGEGANAFRTLGLSMTQVGSASPEQAFRMVIDSMSKITDQSKRAAVAQMIFGEQGIRMMGMMEAGTEGLADTEAKMKSRGTLYDEAQIEQMRQAQRAISELQNAFAGAGGQMAITFSPMVKDAAKALTSMMQVASGFTVSHKDLILQVAAGGAAFYAVSKAVDVVSVAYKTFVTVTKQAITTQAILQALSGPAGIAKLAIGAVAAGAAVYSLNKIMEDIDKTHDTEIEKSKQATAAKERETAVSRQTADALAVEASARKEAAAALDGYLKLTQTRQNENTSLDDKLRILRESIKTASPEVQQAWNPDLTPRPFKADPKKYEEVTGISEQMEKLYPMRNIRSEEYGALESKLNKAKTKLAGELFQEEQKWQQSEFKRISAAKEFSEKFQGVAREGTRTTHYTIEPDKYWEASRKVANIQEGYAKYRNDQTGGVNAEEYERTMRAIRESFGPDVLTAQQEFARGLDNLRKIMVATSMSTEQVKARFGKLLDAMTGTSIEGGKTKDEQYREKEAAITAAENAQAKKERIPTEEAARRRKQLARNIYGDEGLTDTERWKKEYSEFQSRSQTQKGFTPEMAAEGRKRFADQAFSSQVRPGDEKGLKDALEKIRTIQADMDPAEFKRRYNEWAGGLFGVDIKTPAEKVADMAKQLARVTEGMTPEAQKRLTEAARKKTAQETGAQAIIDSQKTPFEKIAEKNKELDKLVEAGQLTQQQKNVAMSGAMKELLPAAKPAQFEAAESLYKRIQGAAAGSGSEDPQKMMLEIQKQSKIQQEKAVKEAENTSKALADNLPAMKTALEKLNLGCKA